MEYRELNFWMTPYRQALVTYVSFFILALIFKLIALGGYELITVRFPWILAGAFLLVYSVFNALVLLTVQSAAKYWSQSIVSYTGFALAGGVTAMLLSGITLNNAGSFRWIYLVISFSYLIFLSIGGLMKVIVTFAQKADTRNFENRRYNRRR